MNTLETGYTAADIEVLEGLEPVRRRPGMYIGGTDAGALHHLFAEVIDNAMDEAVAGFASKIWVVFRSDGSLQVRDNGRGIPVDPHPQYPDKSALEIILTKLHSGGKFSGKAYSTSGGLHGVGISVVNALSKWLDVEVARDGQIWQQRFSRGVPTTVLQNTGQTRNKRGTTVSFLPDEQIFGEQAFESKRLREMVRSKGYLFRGVTLYWLDETVKEGEAQEEEFRYPKGLEDYLKHMVGETPCVTDRFFAGETALQEDGKKLGRLEWALGWPVYESTKIKSYANTVPTSNGGTHETGMRAALLKSMRQYAEMRGKKASSVTADDILNGCWALLSIFIPEAQFQGQTKEKLVTREAARLTENALKDSFDLWLAKDPESADALLFAAIERAEERNKRRKEQEVKRKTATGRKVRLPGKLTDCSNKDAKDTELFIVEGDSAGGSAKQARFRETQAILPLRGKILNVANATKEKLAQNKELHDLTQALGCGLGKDFKLDHLRYERIVIMTDADVDGAHIAALLLTFFFQEMPQLVLSGRVFLAMPPLYKMTHGSTTIFALDDKAKDRHLKTTFKGKKSVEISRFKGLGEMPAAQLKETTMDPKRRNLMQVQLESMAEADSLVRRLMGKNPEERLNFIKETANKSVAVDI